MKIINEFLCCTLNSMKTFWSFLSVQSRLYKCSLIEIYFLLCSHLEYSIIVDVIHSAKFHEHSSWILNLYDEIKHLFITYFWSWLYFRLLLWEVFWAIWIPLSLSLHIWKYSAFERDYLLVYQIDGFLLILNILEVSCFLCSESFDSLHSLVDGRLLVARSLHIENHHYDCDNEHECP